MEKQARIDILNKINIEFDNKCDRGYENTGDKPALSYIKDNKIVTDSHYQSPFPYDSQYLATVIQDNRRKSYQYLSSLTQNGIASSIIETLSSESTKSKIEIKCFEQKSEDYSEIIEKITHRLEELDIYGVMRNALRSNYIFGGCNIFFEIDKNTTKFLEIPLSISPLTISEEKRLTNLKVIDPIFCVPVKINTINPLDCDFYLPSQYSVFGITVDSSRLYRLVTNEAADNIKPMYNFFGISLLQQCEEYIYRFEQITHDINMIIKRMRTSIFSTSMSSLLTGDCTPEEQVAITNSLNTRNSMLHKGNNNSMILLDKELEDFREINTSLTGLSDLLSSISEQLCIVPKIPATKLLGISPKGMNATGESDLNNFYDEITKIQNNYLLPFVKKVVDILHMEITGEKNTHLSVVFEPLNKQAVLDAQVEASFINDTLRAVEIGVVTPNEGRERLSTLGWDLDIEELDESEELAQELLDYKNNELTT